MIDLYLRHRADAGETITKESFVVRNDYDYFVEDMSANPKPVNSWNLNTLFRQLLLKIGLRTQNKSRYSRHETPLLHGFRKWYSSQLVESNLKTELRWLLEGHNLRANDSAYVRVSEKQLLQEYLKAVNNLTISNEERLKVKLEEVQIDKSQYESLRQEFEKFRDAVLKQQQK
jgi:hypothetical protein